MEGLECIFDDFLNSSWDTVDENSSYEISEIKPKTMEMKKSDQSDVQLESLLNSDLIIVDSISEFSDENTREWLNMDSIGQSNDENIKLSLDLSIIENDTDERVNSLLKYSILAVTSPTTSSTSIEDKLIREWLKRDIFGLQNFKYLNKCLELSIIEDASEDASEENESLDPFISPFLNEFSHHFINTIEIKISSFDKIFDEESTIAESLSNSIRNLHFDNENIDKTMALFEEHSIFDGSSNFFTKKLLDVIVHGEVKKLVEIFVHDAINRFNFSNLSSKNIVDIVQQLKIRQMNDLLIILFHYIDIETLVSFGIFQNMRFFISNDLSGQQNLYVYSLIDIIISRCDDIHIYKLSRLLRNPCLNSNPVLSEIYQKYISSNSRITMVLSEKSKRKVCFEEKSSRKKNKK